MSRWKADPVVQKAPPFKRPALPAEAPRRERKVQDDEGRALTSLSHHERHQVANAVRTVRSGVPSEVDKALEALSEWPLPRLFAAAQVAAQRHFVLLRREDVFDTSTSQGTQELINRLVKALPAATTMSSVGYFNALAVATAVDAEGISTRVRANLPAATSQLLVLIAALQAIASHTTPSVSEMLSSARFPDPLLDQERNG